MSYLLNNEQKLTEIIFAHRNKAYGAYVLRSDYGFTIAKSLALVMSGAALLAIAAYLFTRNPQTNKSLAGQVEISDTVIVIPFGKKEEDKVLPKTKTNPPPSTPPETKKPAEHGAALVVDSTAVDNSTAVINNTVVSLVSTSTSIPGDNRDPNVHVTDDKSTGGGDGVAPPFELEKEAEFEGGLQALYKFIRDNLRYPPQAYDAGVDGSVYVKFVVDETGKVSRLTLLNTRGYGLDEEALRVVGMIPKFKSPAMMKGHAVKSYFQVPIRFRIAH